MIYECKAVGLIKTYRGFGVGVNYGRNRKVKLSGERVFVEKIKIGQNNYAFIDSQNLNLAIRSQGWTLDFKRFRQYLKDKYNVTKAFLFIGYVNTNQDLYFIFAG